MDKQISKSEDFINVLIKYKHQCESTKGRIERRIKKWKIAIGLFASKGQVLIITAFIR